MRAECLTCRPFYNTFFQTSCGRAILSPEGDTFRQSRFEKTHEVELSVIISWSTQKDRGEKMSKFGKKNKDSKEAEMKKMKQQLEALKKKQAKKK